VFATHTPLSEVLAVVAEEAIAIFPQSRDCPTNDLVTLQPMGTWGSDPYRMTVREAHERNRFHRAAAPAGCKGPIMNDSAGAQVDPVM
jgi:hypothetical protein